ncbi:hypothetical protein D3C76_1068860 [compost metagenome]
MQHGAPLGHVDLVAVEHGVDGAAQVGLFGQIHQQLEGLFGDQVLGVVDQDVTAEGEGELVETLGILCEQILEPGLFVSREVGFQGLPGLGLGWIDVFHRIPEIPSCV